MWKWKKSQWSGQCVYIQLLNVRKSECKMVFEISTEPFIARVCRVSHRKKKLKSEFIDYSRWHPFSRPLPMSIGSHKIHRRVVKYHQKCIYHKSQHKLFDIQSFALHNNRWDQFLLTSLAPRNKTKAFHSRPLHFYRFFFRIFGHQYGLDTSN